MRNSLALLGAGLVAGAAFVIACSDDSPTDADAAVCDCDPAEPPLAGRIMRVERREAQTTGAPLLAAICPAGSTLLGGGCFAEGPNAGDLRLVMSGFPSGGDPLRYGCDWRNQPGLEVTVVAFATCLIPAAQ